MVEDKLSQRQRVRLEALSQANVSYIVVRPENGVTMEDYLKRAEEIESWLRKADEGIH